MKRNYNPQNDEATSRPRKNVTPLPQEFKDDIKEAPNLMIDDAGGFSFSSRRDVQT